MAMTPGILNSSNTLMKRQKPIRLPYSCQAQFGTSGIGEPPAGGVSTVRGMVCVGSQSSTLTITQTAMRAPFGNLSGARSVIGENARRSAGSIGRLAAVLPGADLFAGFLFGFLARFVIADLIPPGIFV